VKKAGCFSTYIGRLPLAYQYGGAPAVSFSSLDFFLHQNLKPPKIIFVFDSEGSKKIG
jgi:hypothetical protein